MALSNPKTHARNCRRFSQLDNDSAMEKNGKYISERYSKRRERHEERRLYVKSLRKENRNALKEAVEDYYNSELPGTTT